MSFFDFLNAINDTKIDIIRDNSHTEKEYIPFMINRGMSFFPDSIMFANEMNTHSNIPKQWQFDFYLNGVVKKKRFSKWHKPDQYADDLKLVMLEYNYNVEKATSALNILTKQQIDTIKEKYKTGGR